MLFCMLFKNDSLLASIETPICTCVEAIIFDCDGVLVDTEYLKFLAWQKALNHLNIQLSVEEYKSLAGHNSKKIIEKLQEIKEISISEEIIIPLKRREYQKLQEQGIPPIKDTVDFVNYLSQNKDQLGIKLGLASSASKNEIIFNLKQIGLDQAFDLVISGTDDLEDYIDSEGTNKPKPYIYQEASKRMKVRPNHCIVIEDTEAGIEAASGARMITIAIPNRITKEQDFLKANLIFDSSSDLKKQFRDKLGFEYFK